MKYYIIAALLVALLLPACRLATKADKDNMKMKLAYEVTPEDYEQHFYDISWDDTVGTAHGYPDQRTGRPLEVWCVITNKDNDTVGDYTGGISYSWTYAGFKSADSIVNATFMIGLNSNVDRDQLPLSKSEIVEYVNANKTIVFKPISINLKTDLFKKHEVILIEK